MFVANKNPLVFTHTLNQWLRYSTRLIPQTVRESLAFRLSCTNYLELVRAILSKKSNWHTHYSGIIERNINNLRNFNSLIIIVTRLFFW